VPGTCFFCDAVATVNVYYVQRSHVGVRTCAPCIGKINILAHHFGNELRFWVAMEDEGVPEALEPSTITDSDVGDAVLAAMELLKQRYENKGADNDITATAEPTPDTQAKDAPDIGGGPVIF
jgi:hypothetical protein